MFGIEAQEDLEPVIKINTAEGEVVKLNAVNILHRLAKLNMNKTAGVVGFNSKVLYELRNILAFCPK